MPFATPGQLITPGNLKDLRKDVKETYQKSKLLEQALKDHQQPDGINHKTRWLSTNKDYKPLRDLIAEKTDKIHQALAKDLMHPDVQQFVMSPDMAFEVQKLVMSMIGKPEQIAGLIPKVMTPYPRVCVEMPITPEVAGIRLPITEQDMADGVGQLHRIGAYIETDEIKRREGDDGPPLIKFNFMPYYEFATGKVAFSNICLVYLDNKSMTDLGMMPVMLQEYGWIWNGFYSRHVDAVAKQNGVDMLASMQAYGMTDAIKLSVMEAADDLPALFFMWLVLLNSKSGVTKTDIRARFANPGLGKRERARRGRSAFTLITLDDTEKVNIEGVVEPKPLINAHRVRGHFKARKWGVYWWRPFVRGNGELKEREGYKLNKKGTENE